MSINIDEQNTPPAFTRQNIGTFSLPSALFEDPKNLPAIQAMLNGVLIIRCELIYASSRMAGQEFHYTALGPMFREIDAGEEVPVYECTVTTKDGVPTSAKWTNVQSVINTLRGAYPNAPNTLIAGDTGKVEQVWKWKADTGVVTPWNMIRIGNVTS